MTQLAPVTLATRGEASTVTIVATSRGVVNLPVGMLAAIWSRTASEPSPVALPIV